MNSSWRLSTTCELRRLSMSGSTLGVRLTFSRRTFLEICSTTTLYKYKICINELTRFEFAHPPCSPEGHFRRLKFNVSAQPFQNSTAALLPSRLFGGTQHPPSNATNRSPRTQSGSSAGFLTLEWSTSALLSSAPRPPPCFRFSAHQQQLCRR